MQGGADQGFRTTGGTFGGLDGCRSGWVLAVLGPTTHDQPPNPAASPRRWSPLVFELQPDQGHRSDDAPDTAPARLTLSWHQRFADAMATAEGAGARATGVDMPIGLPGDGRRAADDAARALLGHRRSTLFPTPARSVLGATDFTDAQSRSRRSTGRGISIQAWNLIPKIREVDQWMTDGPAGQVFEVHPELAFARLAGGAVLSEPKRSPAGQARRLALLDEQLGLGSAGLAELSTRRPGPGMALDDVLDAMAVCCSCQRLMSGDGAILGGVECDERGLPMRICY